MSKLTSLALTCEFADFIQAYCLTDGPLEAEDFVDSALEELGDVFKRKFNRRLTADELSEEMAEIYITDEQLIGCNEITVYVMGQSFVSDCKDARQLLLNIIRITG